jgi:predicted nucleic acid-binding protein
LLRAIHRGTAPRGRSAAALRAEPREGARDRRDPKGDGCLGLALAAAAAGAVLTDDGNPLVLHLWRGIQVPRPAEFLRELEGGRP